MLRKVLFLLVLLLVLLIVFLLNPWSKKLPTQRLLVAVDSQKSALDKVLMTHINAIKQRPNLIKSLTQPPKTITIKTLWVDKFEVTQGDFYKFIGWSRVYDSTAFFAPKQPQDWKFYSSGKTHRLSGKLGVSANGIGFYDAFTYCRATGARLPTANEFRIITESDEAQLYPWGNQFNSKPWAYYDSRLNATLKPGSFKSSNTKEGVADIGALLSEWTIGNYPAGKPFIQGGNAYSKPFEIYALTMVYRAANVRYRSAYVGFRCVYDTLPAVWTPWKSKTNAVKLSNKTLKINSYPHSKVRPLLRYLPYLSVGDFKSLLPLNRKTDYQLLVGSNEVSVSQYQQFLADMFVSLGIYAHEQQPKNHSLIPFNWTQQQQNPNRPVVSVDWWSAYHFANWVGGRLPSVNEFIKIQALTVAQKSVFKKHQQAYPDETKTSDNIAHLLGNVSEWSRSVDSTKENLSMVVKGGSFLTSEKNANNIDFYRSISPHHRAKDIGFRVVFE